MTKDESTDMKQYFDDLNNNIKPTEHQIAEVSRIFNEVSELIKTLLPGGNVKIIPLGSYTLNCMRSSKLEVDCLLIDRRFL